MRQFNMHEWARYSIREINQFRKNLERDSTTKARECFERLLEKCPNYHWLTEEGNNKS